MADKEELYLRQANPHRAWYVIHTYSGYENKVKANLERLMHSASMSEMIFNVVVPVENEIEMKDGKEKVVPRKVFPGYVLVDMIVDEHSWYVVRNTTGVTGFVGSEKHPIPVSYTPPTLATITHVRVAVTGCQLSRQMQRNTS